MAYITPSIDDFKTKYVRDFPYGTSLATVTDTDITNAFSDASVNMNEGLFNTQDIYNIGFLLMAAHFLVMNLRASSQGLSGQYEWLQSSKSVGSVSEGLSIPERILKNPYFSMLTKTHYGAKYLFLILPQMTGNIFVSAGGTQA